MKRQKYLLTTILALFLATSLVGQNSQISKGDRNYENLAYPDAIRAYEKGLKKDQDLRAAERLADSYKQVGNTLKAEIWYGRIVNMKGAAPINKYYLGEMMKANGKYKAARLWFEAYLQTGENPQRAARAIESCDFATDAKKDSARYKITAEPFNTGSSEISPMIYKQGLIFVSERKKGARRIFNLRNGNYFYDFYYTERSTKKKGYTVQRLKGKVNSKYHDGPGSLSAKKDALYFTRSSYVKNRKGKKGKDASKLKVLTATATGSKWQNIEVLPFNSDQYSCGHPALSSDGGILIFASDIPGGFGGNDLYMCRKEGKGWSTPENLGSSINTEGNENFPYLHANGTLFFSSDGHPGLGGLDIFGATPEGGKWGKVVNAGYPLNTSYDDFSVAWVKGRAIGYFASNRDGDDDIYRFKRQMKINGQIVDSRTKKVIPGASVVVLDANGKESKYTCDKEGKFSHIADWGKDYFITADKDEYLQTREQISTKKVSPFADLDMKLELERDMIFSLYGTVTDAETKKPIKDATIRLISTKDKKYKTDSEGKYFTRVPENREFTVIIQQKSYIPQIFSFSTEGKTDPEDFVFNAALVKGHYILVEGKAFRKDNNVALPGVNVRSVDTENRKEIKATQSRKDGRFYQVLDPSIDQYLIGSKIGFFSSRADLPPADTNRVDTTISVEMAMVPYEIGAMVKTIYYDYDKSDIKTIASKDLYEIIYFLAENPEVSVELSSHTDCRGGHAYNEKLSQRRSDASVKYITDRGIEKKRVTAKGYGETKLVNKCKDGTECTEEEHAENRRTEIKVVELDMSKAKESWKKSGSWKIESEEKDVETIVK